MRADLDKMNWRSTCCRLGTYKALGPAYAPVGYERAGPICSRKPVRTSGNDRSWPIWTVLTAAAQLNPAAT